MNEGRTPNCDNDVKRYLGQGKLMNERYAPSSECESEKDGIKETYGHFRRFSTLYSSSTFEPDFQFWDGTVARQDPILSTGF